MILEKEGKTLNVLTDCPTAEDIAYFQSTLSRERIAIYKYYNDGEERNPDIPDVLDTIDDEIDRLESHLAKIADAAYRGDISRLNRPSRYYDEATPKQLKAKIEALEAMREEILKDEEHVYYKLSNLHGYFRHSEKLSFAPAQICELSLYKPKFNMQTLKWDAEPTTLKCLTFDNSLYVVLHDCVTFLSNVINAGMGVEVTEKYYSLDKDYIIERLNPEGDVVKLCKKCGRPFRLTKSHVDWYWNKNFSLPNYCCDCRKERRKEKQREEERKWCLEHGWTEQMLNDDGDDRSEDFFDDGEDPRYDD